jgi:cell division protein ZapA
MEERLVQFQLFGQEFTFVSDASDAEVDEIVKLVLRELEGSDGKYASSIPSSKMLVLGCLRIASRFVQQKQEIGEYRRRQESAIDNLIDRVDAVV